MQALRQQSYAGRLIPVTAKQDSVMGWPTLPRLSDSGETVDLVLIAVPQQQVQDCLRDAAAAGARCAVVITAGYADAGTEAGQTAERELVAFASSLGIRLVGPNCNGLMVGSENLYLGPNMLARKVPGLQSGPLCLISQSGSVMGTLMAQTHALGLGTGLCVSLGNQADLDACDFLEYALSQDDLKIICLYLEEPQLGFRPHSPIRAPWSVLTTFSSRPAQPTAWWSARRCGKCRLAHGRCSILSPYSKTVWALCRPQGAQPVYWPIC